MTEPIETDISNEPELESGLDETLEAPAEQAEALDYDRIIGGVTQRIAQAAQELHARQTAPDPYAEVADMIWDNPSEAIQRTVDIATRNAVEAMMPYVQPVSQGYAMQRVTHGLNEEGQAFVHAFVREKGIDPALLNDPTVADLVRSKAELHQMKGGSRPVPSMESAGGYASSNLDAQTQQALSGIEQLYKNLNLKFEPAKLLGRVK